jgi:hypothetical protein
VHEYDVIPEYFYRSDTFYERPTVMGIFAEELLSEGGTVNDPGVGTYPTHWFLKTQRMLGEDSYRKVLRRSMVDADLTGNWQMSVMILKENESLVAALRRKVYIDEDWPADVNWNLIVDSASANEHLVNGTSYFQTNLGNVDVYYTPYLYKMYDSRGVGTASGADKINFAVSLDSSDRSGRLLVIPEDSADIRHNTMIDDDAYYGHADAKYGDTVMLDRDHTKKTNNWNVKGRDFSLWLSNVGTYQASNHWAKPGAHARIHGWGIWVRRTDVENY